MPTIQPHCSIMCYTKCEARTMENHLWQFCGSVNGAGELLTQQTHWQTLMQKSLVKQVCSL